MIACIEKKPLLIRFKSVGGNFNNVINQMTRNIFVWYEVFASYTYGRKMRVSRTLS